ncbi:S49 family peptidase [Methylobacterium sp.]|uniref:S49 family peptidase n=1 Tax=Methylobacterium sp. TaxID=409 RepID=UPI0025D063B6|nr:S49 family peptidase [Methylobacterium sp.]MBY0260126.1 S49 family peptidase [Methylobacterium sp.]
MNILDAAVASAWAMEESALAGLLSVAAREHQVTPAALAAYRAEALKKADRAAMRDGVAILSVEGPLFKRANLMTELCGATSYATLMRDLQAAVDDVDVRAILLNVDSPGGEASGVGEFADAVKAVRGKKPIVAYAGDLAASAAYWIGSAADRLVIGKGAALGSIGVRMTMSDASEREAKGGVRRFDFVSSQSPYKVSDPAKKAGAARIQARIDVLANVFVAAVAENRGVTVAHVLDAFGKGDVLIGEAAIAAGMADGFGTFESTLAALAAEGDPFVGFSLPRAAAKVRPLAAVPDAASAILAAFEMAQPRRAQPAIPPRIPGLTPRPVMSPRAPAEEAAVQAILEAARRRL